MSKKNYIGMTFGDLTVTQEVAPYVHNGRTYRMLLCKCKCGKEKVIKAESLCSKRTLSCGCLKSTLLSNKNKKHGLTNDPLYTTWKGMRERCSNKKQWYHKYYFDKGIKVCEEWNDFKKFREWAFCNGWEKGLQIDRINDNDGYSPSNCRIVTRKENCLNKKNTIFITLNGETKCQAEWCKILQISPSTVISISNKYNISRTCAIKMIYDEGSMIRPKHGWGFPLEGSRINRESKSVRHNQGGRANGFDSYNQEVIDGTSQTLKCPNGGDSYPKCIIVK